MKEIDSSTISHVDYKDGVLSVKFKSNPKIIYDYPGVTADEHAAFMASSSKGSHHARNFKHREFVRREG